MPQKRLSSLLVSGNLNNKYCMATFIGYSTINQYKKFTLTDGELVKRDLLNAFNIRQGTLPGRPDYGSTC
jgi:hypothetical protein